MIIGVNKTKETIPILPQEFKSANNKIAIRIKYLNFGFLLTKDDKIKNIPKHRKIEQSKWSKNPWAKIV